MKGDLFIFILFITNCVLQIDNASNNNGLHRVIRVKKFNVTNDDNTLRIINVSLHGTAYEESLSAVVELTRNIYVDMAKFEINRCQYDGFYCEYFQTWTLKNGLGRLMYMKNQMWSPMIYALTPKLTFPSIHKNTFHLHNGTVDADAIVAFYKEATKYAFDVKFSGIDLQRNRTDLWVHFAFNIFEYRKRNRPAKKDLV